MLVTRRNQNLMPALFNELFDFGNDLISTEHTMTPKLNISESDKSYDMVLCVPGLRKEDLAISIDSDNQLVVEMQQKHEEKHEDKDNRHYLRHEFSSMQFKQAFCLPDNVKRDQISARVENGILYITLPKFTVEEKKALAQTIAIQ